MKSIITTFALLCISFIALGQSEQFAKLDSFFTLLHENDRFFGSVAVTSGGELIYSKALGYADLEADIPNTVETKFRVGSISKTFTATLVMKAVELNKLDLDQTIDVYFPRIQNAENISVRHLLNHRSGITNFTDRSYSSWYTKPITSAALLDTIVSKGSDFEPDTDYSYSNSNYVLLSFILENTLDNSYPEILKEYIAGPLALKNTSYGDVINTADNDAKSYQMKSSWELEAEGDMSIPLGAGGVVSTPTDLCRFADALFGGEIISKESLQLMKPVGEEEYGFAIYGTEFYGKQGFGHGGNIDAFASNLICFEEKDLCFALSCNGSNFGTHDVELAVMGELFDEPYELPSFDFVELSDEELDLYLGTYVTDDLPMDMTFTKEDNTLFLEVTGQSPGPLQAEGNHKFSIMVYGVKIEFYPEEKKMHFEQQGQEFDLVLQEATENVEPAKFVQSGDADLDKYVGTYTSDALPIDLTISKDRNQLIGQGEGQPSFRLMSEGDHKYSNKEIGLTITFIPDENKMQFVQGGAEFEMVSRD